MLEDIPILRVVTSGGELFSGLLGDFSQHCHRLTYVKNREQTKLAQFSCIKMPTQIFNIRSEKFIRKYLRSKQWPRIHISIAESIFFQKIPTSILWF